MSEATKKPTTNSSREKQYDEFVALLTRNDMAIRRFVRLLMPSHDGVDDVMQETALECWKKFADFQAANESNQSEEFVRWACVIARFKTLSWQRDKSRDRLVFRESVVESLSETILESHTKQQLERAAVESCLSKLPPDQQKLVLSVHTPGVTIARIAKQTGEQVRRLYSRVNVIRSLLQDCIDRELQGDAANG